MFLLQVQGTQLVLCEVPEESAAFVLRKAVELTTLMVPVHQTAQVTYPKTLISTSTAVIYHILCKKSIFLIKLSVTVGFKSLLLLEAVRM